MAAELQVRERMVERVAPGGALLELEAPGQLAQWQEMMALLLCARSSEPTPERQTCTECDSGSPLGALPPEAYLG
ncbi:MAG: hypothetical protein ACYCYK_06205 [Candidatus Dormibacteria bacterium]